MGIDLNTRIILKLTENPKRGKSRQRYQQYIELDSLGQSFTVGDYIDRCEAKGLHYKDYFGDIRWDLERRFIDVVTPDGKYELPPKGTGKRSPTSIKKVATPLVKSGSALQEPPSELRILMARSWFGYGHWEAPYWFVGIEQGGQEDQYHRGDDRAWHEMGERELLDCRDHHRRMGDRGNPRWHTESATIQKTWGAMIRLLLTFKNETANDSSVLDYQKNRWGASGGETAVLELGGGRARSSSSDNEFRTDDLIRKRVSVLHHRLETFRPKLVIFYGISKKKEFEQILGTSMNSPISAGSRSFMFTKAEKPFATYGRHAGTIGVCVFHPSQRFGSAPPDSDWILLGESLAKLMES
jgi:hypothetical protein